MRLLVREFETVIANILPKSFGIIFEGWIFRSEHYVAVFASFRHDGKAQNILIAMAPIIDDEVDDYTANSHIKFLDTIISFGRSKASIAYIVGDNCSVNGAVADQLQVPMLKEYLDDGDDEELTAVMPSRREEKQLKAILDNLKMFESTSKKLQSADNITLLDVHDLFDALIAQKPEGAHYLDAEAAIVKSVDFEHAKLTSSPRDQATRVNVLLGREGLMSA
ncbi:hypothetical protein BBJ28_00021062 [Nothophytophthora sp. Chile5]|nr:hypothetical protein BBJ28_00021062 [Nothophytophthora sp. Chile5]